MDRASIAKIYADAGWRVLPIHTPNGESCSCIGSCDSPGKHPRVRNGVHDASDKDEDIDKWWGRLWPDANIAIACGEISNLIVLDIDPRNGGDDELARLTEEHGELPRTVSVVTGGGGTHYYFRPRDSRTRKRIIAPGVDLVGDGGYVVAPPSVHHSGGRYEFQGGGIPHHLPIAPVPEWLLEVCQVRSGSHGGTVGFDLPPEEELREIHKGQRNVMLARAAGAMRRWGFSNRVINEALQQHNREVCHPPLPEEEVENIAYSISRYEPEITVENGENKSEEGSVVSVEGC